MGGIGTQVGQFLWSAIRAKLARRPATAFQAFPEALFIRPEGDLQAFSFNLGDRITLIERFVQVPGLNTDIAIAYNLGWEIIGTGASSGDATFDPEGGIDMETDASASQEVIVTPHLDSEQSAFAAITWGTDQETWFETSVKTAAALADVTWAGLKLTNTAVIATDANQVFFRATNTGNWGLVYSIANVDVTIDTGVAIAVSSVYRLKILIDSSRIAYGFINGVLVATTTALTDAIDLIPYVGVQGNAKAITVRYVALSRNAA